MVGNIIFFSLRLSVSGFSVLHRKLTQSFRRHSVTEDLRFY